MMLLVVRLLALCLVDDESFEGFFLLLHSTPIRSSLSPLNSHMVGMLEQSPVPVDDAFGFTDNLVDGFLKKNPSLSHR